MTRKLDGIRTGDIDETLATLVIVALVIALAVVGYLYYQRTRNDITIQLPKVGVNN
jgi:RsiW-degrading membrane proteinase PrsW (M82 family)